MRMILSFPLSRTSSKNKKKKTLNCAGRGKLSLSFVCADDCVARFCFTGTFIRSVISDNLLVFTRKQPLLEV